MLSSKIPSSKREGPRILGGYRSPGSRKKKCSVQLDSELISVILSLNHFLFGVSVLHREDENMHSALRLLTLGNESLRSEAYKSKRVFRKPGFNNIPLNT